ncbi:MAG: CHRD domain-containing protein [Armatimonadetes bacterium]|nr:CHRD domain-containing protein [Armatimonadota bacterium]
MKKTVILFGIGMGLSASSFASLWAVTSTLDGISEVPPNASPAVGVVAGIYDDVTNTLTMDTSASGLLGPSTAAHIHTGAPGTSGAVLFPLTGTVGSTTYLSHDMFVLTDASELDLLGGMLYVNVHSTVFPGGEIRGQLAASTVPEPASLAVLGFGALAMLKRRKR